MLSHNWGYYQNIMQLRKFNYKLILSLILGTLAILVSLFVIFQNLGLKRNSAQNSNAELELYENKNLHLSFQYPKSLFVREETRDGNQVVTLSPLSGDNKLNNSSIGLASALIIELFRGENLDDGSPLRTQSINNIAFREEPVTIDDVHSIHQYYNDAYSGGQIETWLIPCNKYNPGVFAIRFLSSPLADQYRSVVSSVKVCK